MALILAILVVAIAAGATLLSANHAGKPRTSSSTSHSVSAISTAAPHTTTTSTNSEIETVHSSTTISSTSSVSSSSSEASSSSAYYGVVSNITVGNSPRAIAFDPKNGYLYVANSGSCREPGPSCGYVSVIDGRTNNIVANLSNGFSWPDDIALDSSNGHLFVANEGSDYVTVIDGAINAVFGYIPIGCNTTGIVFDPLNGYLYTSDSSYYSSTGCAPSTLSVIDGNTDQEIANITGGTFSPSGLAYDPVNGLVYVADSQCGEPANCGNVSLVDTYSNTVQQQVALGMPPQELAFDTANDYLYAAGVQSPGISIVDTKSNTALAPISLDAVPSGITYDPLNGYLVVSVLSSDNKSGSINMINASSGIAMQNITVGINPESPVVDISNGKLYVANEGSGTVAVLSTGSDQSSDMRVSLGSLSALVSIILLALPSAAAMPETNKKRGKVGLFEIRFD